MVDLGGSETNAQFTYIKPGYADGVVHLARATYCERCDALCAINAVNVRNCRLPITKLDKTPSELYPTDSGDCVCEDCYNEG